MSMCALCVLRTNLEAKRSITQLFVAGFFHSISSSSFFCFAWMTRGLLCSRCLMSGPKTAIYEDKWLLDGSVGRPRNALKLIIIIMVDLNVKCRRRFAQVGVSEACTSAFCVQMFNLIFVETARHAIKLLFHFYIKVGRKTCFRLLFIELKMTALGRTTRAKIKTENFVWAFATLVGTSLCVWSEFEQRSVCVDDASWCLHEIRVTNQTNSSADWRYHNTLSHVCGMSSLLCIAAHPNEQTQWIYFEPWLLIGIYYVVWPRWINKDNLSCWFVFAVFARTWSASFESNRHHKFHLAFFSFWFDVIIINHGGTSRCPILPSTGGYWRL